MASLGKDLFPRHYAHGVPTPWKEGFVVRFSDEYGQSWIGNFQQGGSYYSTAVLWPEADKVIVIAKGACYLLSAADPADFRVEQTTATGYLFSKDRQALFVADYTDVYAYGRRGEILWKREYLGIDGVSLEKADLQVVSGRACSNPPDEWYDFRISPETGKDVRPDL